MREGTKELVEWLPLGPGHDHLGHAFYHLSRIGTRKWLMWVTRMSSSWSRLLSPVTQRVKKSSNICKFTCYWNHLTCYWYYLTCLLVAWRNEGRVKTQRLESKEIRACHVLQRQHTHVVAQHRDAYESCHMSRIATPTHACRIWVMSHVTYCNANTRIVAHTSYICIWEKQLF